MGMGLSEVGGGCANGILGKWPGWVTLQVGFCVELDPCERKDSVTSPWLLGCCGTKGPTCFCPPARLAWCIFSVVSARCSPRFEGFDFYNAARRFQVEMPHFQGKSESCFSLQAALGPSKGAILACRLGPRPRACGTCAWGWQPGLGSWPRCPPGMLWGLELSPGTCCLQPAG